MTERRALRILLVLKHAGYIGVYARLVTELAERGHTVHVAYVGAPVPLVERVAAHPSVTHGPAARRGIFDGWSSVAWLVRALGDLARYSHPRYADATALRRRMAEKVESHLTTGAGFDPLTRRLALRRAHRLHAQTDTALSERTVRKSLKLERALPVSRRVTAFVRRHAPDVVLVSPAVDLAAHEAEYVKAARRLGIPAGICIASWDNLSSKGLLHVLPERVFVWNDVQRDEAVELHGVPTDRVVATGASRFDDWFDQQPSTSREQFARKVGLDPARPYVLYLCSSVFVAPDEVRFVSRWIAALRGSGDERLRELGVVVRPHPKRVDVWSADDLAALGNVALWPRNGRDADPAEVRADFFDSIAHSAAVVGVNTSAMLESAIAGKPVYTLVLPEFAQQETIHFHYLLHEHGGVLRVASSLDEHLAQLGDGLDGPTDERAQLRRFVEGFLRPHGLERSATPIYADAVEELAALRAQPANATLLPRLMLAPVALASSVALAATIGRAALRSKLLRKPAAAALTDGRVRVLFSLLHPGYLRHYAQPIRLLAQRGHEVHVALGRLEKDPGDARLIEQLAADCETVTYSVAPARKRQDGWRRIAWLVRALTDLARYAHPRFAAAPALRARIAEKLHWRLDYSRLPRSFKPPFHSAIERLATGADAALSERTLSLLARLEEAVPTSRRVTRFVAAQRPDVVLASPVTEFASSQIEYLKSARRLGIRTGICVASWDNLTGKGLLRFVPDRVVVWNEIQRNELEEMHGIPRERVVLTGAQRFDDWFGRGPSTGAAEFARNVGLDPAQRYVLYLCSSPFIAPNEVDFVRRWLEAIRKSDSPSLRPIGVLVRPHPQNGLQWRGIDLAEFGNAVVWPPEGAQPDAGEARAGYFDSLAHSACIVGINTSGLIEAGIVGKSVLTVVDDDFAGTQEGTLHFHYLRWENGGLLHVASNLDEHLEQLERAVAGGAEDAQQVTSFVERFCRPFGLDEAAAPRVAGAIEELGRLGPAPRTHASALALALRAALYPVAGTMTAIASATRAFRRARGIAGALTSRRSGSAGALTLGGDRQSG
jgi:hypothetical protein